MSEELCWDFDRDCIESVDCHFYYVDPMYPRAWEIFLFSVIVFNFFLQRVHHKRVLIYFFLAAAESEKPFSKELLHAASKQLEAMSTSVYFSYLEFLFKPSQVLCGFG